MKRKRKQKTVKGEDPFLPEEIITNIVIRLPVKSLIRFRCVSKYWKNLIETPSFIEEHLHHSSHQNPSLMIVDEHSLPNLLRFYLLDNEMRPVEAHSARMINLRRDSRIIGSSHGLLCVRLSISPLRILLWNPAIRQVRPVARAANCLAGKDFKLGFGFSSIVNDFKILIIYNISNRIAVVRQGEVYSLKTGSWKKVESGPLDGVDIVSGGIPVNGCIFWIGVKCSVMRKDDVLVSYDMAVEVFTLIPLPSSESFHLTVHENKLAMLCHTCIGDFETYLLNLWVMEEGKSGERWSWTKKYSIGQPVMFVPETILGNKMVCRFRRMGATIPEVLDDEEGNAVLINLTTNEFERFSTRQYGMSHPLLTYVESLVPVSNDDIEELELWY